MATSIIIPTLNGGPTLAALLTSLPRQTHRACETLVIDSGSTDDTADLARRFGCRLITIEPGTFDHGGTRNRAAAEAGGDILVFLTQDVQLITPDFLARLIAPLEHGRAAAAYARQVGRDTGPATDTYLRLHNYPPGDAEVLRTAADIATLGVRAFMLSNAASAVRRDAFEAVGRFPDHVIMNEDMLLCARLLRAGHTVAYVPQAQVWHSHRYTLRQHMARYFDIGVFMARHGDELGAVATTGGGVRFLAGQLAWLARTRRWLALIPAVMQAAAKWLGYQLGRRYAVLPASLCRFLSLHHHWWTKQISRR